MGALRLAAAILLVAMLATPLAAAASAKGTLEATSLLLTGPVTLDASALDLRWAGEGAPDLQITAATVHVERIGTRTDQVGTLYALDTEPFRERADHGASTLRLEPGDADAILALRGGATTGELADAEIRPVAHAIVAQSAPTRVCDEGDPLCMEAGGVVEAASTRASLQLPSELKLLVRGPTLVVDEGGQAATYASGATTSSDGPATRTEQAWLLVTLTGATGTLVADGDIAAYAPSPTFTTARATLADATGRLDEGLRAYVARGEVVDIVGELELTPEQVPAGPEAPRDGPTYASAVDVRVAGDVQSVSVRAVPLVATSPAAAVGAAAVLAALAGVLAYGWQHATFYAASLYTRLRQPDILENDVRNRIYEIIRANPGISARAVHRESDQSWGTVVYHLRQLERHHLVVSRSVGRTRNYYENHGKYRGMEVQLACLQSARARALARLVLENPGISQEELVTRSEFPQPTTSYYVRKLKAAGLVQEMRDGRYARYQPLGDVARFLELAESRPADATPEAGPAQA